MEELLRASLLEFSCRKMVKQMNYLLVPAAKSTKQSKTKQPPLEVCEASEHIVAVFWEALWELWTG